MIRFLLPILIFFLFVFEGTVMQVFSPEGYIIVPRFSVIVVLMITIFLGRATGTSYAIAMGFLNDVIYTHILGVYAFSMAFVVYMLGYPFKVLQKNILLLMLMAVTGTLVLEYLVYGIHTMVGLTQLEHLRFFKERLVPSFLINGVFAILVAIPLRKFLLYLQKRELIEEKMND